MTEEIKLPDPTWPRNVGLPTWTENEVRAIILADRAQQAAQVSAEVGVEAKSIARLLTLVGEYWDIGHKEGKEGRDLDTPDGVASKKWNEIRAEARYLAAAQPVAPAPALPPATEENAVWCTATGNEVVKALHALIEAAEKERGTEDTFHAALQAIQRFSVGHSAQPAVQVVDAAINWLRDHTQVQALAAAILDALPKVGEPEDVWCMVQARDLRIALELLAALAQPQAEPVAP